jgi:hypothetical protein
VLYSFERYPTKIKLEGAFLVVMKMREGRVLVFINRMIQRVEKTTHNLYLSSRNVWLLLIFEIDYHYDVCWRGLI